MIEQIKCCECEKSENCNRVAEYCWHEVELYAEKVKAETVRKIIDYVKSKECYIKSMNSEYERMINFLEIIIKEDK